MRIKTDYILRVVAGTNVVLPIGEATVKFNGMLTLNGSGVMLWQQLEKETSFEDLVALLCEKYDGRVEIKEQKEKFSILVTVKIK